MTFEGLDIGCADDVRRHLLDGTQTEPRDEHPWEWAERFAKAHPEHLAWLDEALVGVVESVRVDGELQPHELADAAFDLAWSTGVKGLLSVASAQLARDMDGWDPDDVRIILDYTVRLNLTELDAATTERVVVHGRKKHCFATALGLLADVDVPRAATFLGEELGKALKAKSVDAMERAASVYVLGTFASHRPAIVEALKKKAKKHLGAFRDACEEEAEIFGPRYRDAVTDELDDLLG